MGLHRGVHSQCRNGGLDIDDLRIPLPGIYGRLRSRAARCKLRCKQRENQGNSGTAWRPENRRFPLRRREFYVEPPQVSCFTT